eukprot:TRINITY_DN3024_c1_g1_i1.p3 TRINITY_DN3024_c1_g1~~TRINITY_DN3024_c1_g1_i1.p3  ORF type:complete len:136 (+),score=28.11 TRINITY_DN3024_c1_g1_i1:115-522(+)
MTGNTKNSSFGILYHLVQKNLWDEAKLTGSQYEPPTYKQDGFTHLTDKAENLLPIGNAFYNDIQGDFLVLEIAANKLKGEVKFEDPAAVGDKERDDAAVQGQQCPHLYGLIDFDSVKNELKVERDEKGTFLKVQM